MSSLVLFGRSQSVAAIALRAGHSATGLHLVFGEGTGAVIVLGRRILVAVRGFVFVVVMFGKREKKIM